MKAKIKSRIQLENRESLKDAIPLSTPWVIFVDPSDLCNFKCKFCPTGNNDIMRNSSRKPQLMSWSVFVQIVEDIQEFDKPIKVLRLYKDGEPLLNPRFADMVRLAKKNKCAEKIDTTTNGYFLDPIRSLEIINAGLDRINISVEGINAEQYLEFSGVHIDFDKFVDNIRFFYENKKQCEVFIKICGDTLSDEDKQKFYEIFGDICDGISIEHTMNCWNDFEMDGMKQNEEVGIYGQPIQDVDICPYVFYSMSINSDGTVSLCFLDWNRKLYVDDVKTESVKDIWNGMIFEASRLYMLLGSRKKYPSVCRDCNQLSHGMPVDLDNYREMLLERLTYK